MSNIYLASDHHFFHKAIIKYCDRPYKDEYEMNEDIVLKHNSIVKNNDIIIFLGDLSAGLQNRKESLKEVIKSLNGKKILLRGNHDHETDKFYNECDIETVGNFLKVKNYFLNHYPLEENEYTKEPELNMINEFLKSDCTTIIHGHRHTSKYKINESLGRIGSTPRINVALDMINFEPYRLFV